LFLCDSASHFFAGGGLLTGTQVQTLFGMGTNVVGRCVVGRVVWWNHWWFGVCLVQSICKKEKKEKEKRQKVNHEEETREENRDISRDFKKVYAHDNDLFLNI
jgi:tmRNA-binding protein